MGRIFLVILVAAVALSVAAVRYLPWWGIALGLVGVYFAVRFGLKFVVLRLLQSAFMIPFKAKGAVLRGAMAEVHSVEPVKPPADRVEEDMVAVGGDEPGRNLPQILVPREYYRVDVTISPRGHAGPFVFWEPRELLLIPADAGVGLRDLDAGSHAEDVEIYQDGRFGPDEEGRSITARSA